MTDINYQYAAAVLPFDGANNSPSITDGRMNAVSNIGNVRITTDYHKFSNGSSAYFPRGGYISFDNGDAFSLRNLDFTISLWVYFMDYPLNTGGYNTMLLSKDIPSTGRSWQFGISGSVNSLDRIFFDGFYEGGDTLSMSPYTTFNLNQWYFLEFTRSGNSAYYFVDGGLLNAGGSGYSCDIVHKPATTMKVGTLGITNYEYYFKGCMDDLVILIGKAWHTADYTPPAAPYEAAAYGHRATGLILPRHNPDLNGPGTLTGYTRVQTGPTTYTALGNCVVSLLDAKTKRIVAQTVSDNAGNYTFTDLNPARSYYANAFDPTGTYDVTATNNLQVI